MAAALQTPSPMGKRDNAKKELKRLQLRREVIRVLGGDSLARVAGGIEVGDETLGGTCWPSKISITTTGKCL